MNIINKQREYVQKYSQQIEKNLNHIKKKTLIILMSSLMIVLTYGQTVAEGLGPNDPECYELGTCDFFQAPIEVISQPFEAVLGVYMYPIVWGTVLGLLYLRTESTIMVGIVGVMLSLFITFSTQAQQIGAVLLMLSIGVVLYQLISTRIHFPQG